MPVPVGIQDERAAFRQTWPGGQDMRTPPSELVEQSPRRGMTLFDRVILLAILASSPAFWFGVFWWFA